MKRLAAAFIGCALLFSVPTHGGTPARGQIQTDSDSLRPPSAPRVVQPVSASMTESATGQRENEKARADEYARQHSSREKTIADWTKILGILTGLLVVCAVTQAIFFWWQLGLMKRTVEETSGAVDAAKRSAEATEDSVRVLNINSLRELRAYLSCEMSQAFVMKQDATTTWEFYPTWINSGRSPTKNLRTSFEMLLSENEILDSNLLPWQYERAGEAFLVAGGKSDGPRRIVGNDDLRAVAQRAKFLYFFGWMKYESIFAEEDQYESRFAVSVELLGDPDTPVVTNPIADRPPLNGFMISYKFMNKNNSIS